MEYKIEKKIGMVKILIDRIIILFFSYIVYFKKKLVKDVIENKNDEIDRTLLFFLRSLGDGMIALDSLQQVKNIYPNSKISNR